MEKFISYLSGGTKENLALCAPKKKRIRRDKGRLAFVDFRL